MDSNQRRAEPSVYSSQDSCITLPSARLDTGSALFSVAAHKPGINRQLGILETRIEVPTNRFELGKRW